MRAALCVATSLFLVACGGGGGASPESGGSEVNSIELVRQALDIERPSSLNISEPLELIGSRLSPSTDLTSLNETDVTRENSTERLYVLDSDGNIELIGYVSEGDEAIKVSPETTAISLIGSYPSIAPTYNLSPNAFYESIRNFDEVRLLTELISSTEDWSDFDSDPLIEAYAYAVIRVLEAIESDSLIAATTMSSQTHVGAQRVIGHSPQDSTSGITKVVEELGEDLKVSGVTVSIDGEIGVEEVPEFELSAVNDLERYVSILVGSKAHEHGFNQFMLGPKSSSYNSATELFNTELLIEATNSTNYIFAYGPGVQLSSFYPYSDLSESRVNAAYREASLLTLVDADVIPYLSDSKANEECLRSHWIQVDDDGFPYLSLPASIQSSLPVIYPLLESQDYGDAARNLISFLSAESVTFVSNAANSGQVNGAVPDIISCSVASKGDLIDSVLDTLLKLLSAKNALWARILGGVDSSLSNNSKFEKFFEFDPKLQKALASANPQERWELSNLHVKDSSRINIYPTKGLNAATPGSYIPDVSAQKTAYKYFFAGECPEDNYCDWFVFNRERPNLEYQMTFDTSVCDNDSASNECRNTLLTLEGQYTGGVGGTKEKPDLPLSSSVIEPTYEFKAERDSYTGTFSVADLDGAYADYPFHIQLEEAQPEIEVYVDGEKLDKSSPEIEFECEVSGQPVSKSVTIKNIGLGKLYLADGNHIFRGEWSLNEDFEGQFGPMELSTGQSVTRQLSNSCPEASSAGSGSLKLMDYYDEYVGATDWNIKLELKDTCEDATAPEILSLTKSCVGSGYESLDVSFKDTSGLLVGSGYGVFDPNNKYSYPTRLWFRHNGHAPSVYEFAANSYSANLVEGNQFEGTVRVTVKSLGYDIYCEQTDYYDTKYQFWELWKIGLLNSCSLEAETAPFELNYWAN